MTASDTTGVENPKVKPPRKSAAGIPAVVHALEYSLEQTSLRRTAINLLNINQANGIDCPGCAGPEREEGRAPAKDYCETGANQTNDGPPPRGVAGDFSRDPSVPGRGGKWNMGPNERAGLPNPMDKRPAS